MQYTPAEQPVAGAHAPSGLTTRTKLLVVGLLAAVAFGYFGFVAFQSATAYYLTVDEVIERGPNGVPASLQVKGTLVPDTFSRAGADGEPTTMAVFVLEENGAQLDATYEGALPDLFFNPHSEIVLSGTYRADGVFDAERILVKCPSKYQSLEGDPPPDYAAPAA
ncbi:MAG: cytochrome c maturation protein CcmE [Chloroflexota bacterium]|nr:cytochrome c maturation protein CcmE [Chloroflexota bacterium]